MDMTEWIREHSWVLAPAFIVTLAIIIWIKSKLGNNVEIKPVDVGIALIPFVLWMATAGILKKVEVPGIVSFETADVIVNAAAEPINLQVSTMPVTELKADAKRGVEEIPHMIESGTQVLSFKLGYSGYYGPAIWMYFNHLIKSPAFKYGVIIDHSGSLFGLFEARELTAILNPENNVALMKEFLLTPFRGLPDQSAVGKWSQFAERIKRNDTKELSKMLGFVSLSKAVKPTEDKKRVLERMEQQGLDWLPVVKLDGGAHRFQGIVERSRLTASLILDVTRQLEIKKKEQEN